MAKKLKQHQPTRAAAQPEFAIAGRRYPLASMLAENGEDEDVTSWLLSAKPGDVYEAMHAEPVQCVESAS